MNYQERISKLETFKTQISGGTTENSTDGFSSDIAEWSGGSSKGKYTTYISKVISDSKKISKQKKKFLADIDTRIDYIQNQFNNEFNRYRTVVNSIHDSDIEKRKTKKQDYLNSLTIDSSVKSKLRNSI